MTSNGVSVVVVVFDTDPALLDECLRSLNESRSATTSPIELIIIDNSPHRRLEDRFSTDVDMWLSGHGNIGFGRAVNLGVKETHHENILLLNPDAALEGPALESLIETGGRHENALLCGWLGQEGRVQVDAYMHWWSSTGRLLRRSRYRNYLGRAAATRSVVPVQKVSGGGLYARRSLLKELGPFDERFFLYGEDADLSVRARKRGHDLLAVPAAPIAHRAASSHDRHSAMIERARTDASIRISRYHLPFLLSVLTQIDLAVVTVIGLLAAKASSSGNIAARAGRLTIIRRWGLRQEIPPFQP